MKTERRKQDMNRSVKRNLNIYRIRSDNYERYSNDVKIFAVRSSKHSGISSKNIWRYNSCSYINNGKGIFIGYDKNIKAHLVVSK